MSDEIKLKDGKTLKPTEDSSLGISKKQRERLIEEFQKNDSNFLMQQHLNNIYRSQIPSEDSIDSGRRSFIDQFAHKTAQALKETPTIVDKVINALSALCGNPTYNSSSYEDPMNDYVRDMLRQNIDVSDQTRQGISGESKSAEDGNAGELDAQIWFNRRPIGIYEGLRLSKIDSTTIYSHIKKSIINYNPQGLKNVFVTAYVQNHTDDFGDFWNKFSDCVKKFDEKPVTWEVEEIDTGMSAVRGIYGVYQMDGQDHILYVFAVKIQK